MSRRVVLDSSDRTIVVMALRMAAICAQMAGAWERARYIRALADRMSTSIVWAVIERYSREGDKVDAERVDDEL